jgi:hypothetical protein
MVLVGKRLMNIPGRKAYLRIVLYCCQKLEADEIVEFELV